MKKKIKNEFVSIENIYYNIHSLPSYVLTKKYFFLQRTISGLDLLCKGSTEPKLSDTDAKVDNFIKY